MGTTEKVFHQPVIANDEIARPAPRGHAPQSIRDKGALFMNKLIAAAEDDRVEGVRLRIDDLGAGVAQIQELRTLLTRVSAAGTPAAFSIAARAARAQVVSGSV